MEQRERVDGGIEDLLCASVAERRRCMRAHPDPPAWMADLVEEAERLVIGDLGRALESVELLAGLAAELGDARVEAMVHRARGHALAYANRFDEALESLDRAVAGAERAGDVITAGRANLTRLHVLSRSGRAEAAIAAGEAALAAFRSAGEPSLAARAEANLGVVHRLRGNHVESLASFDRARAVLGADPIAAAQLDSNRAETFLDLDRFGAAEEAFTSALRSFNEAGLDRAAAIVEGNLADLASRQGRLDGAMRHFDRARRRLLEAESPGDAARLRAEESEVLLAVGLHDDAAAHLTHAVQTLASHGLAWEAARACAALGFAHARARRYRDARDALEDARERFAQLDQAVGIGRVERGLAEIALAEGELDQANARLDAAAARLRDRPAETVANETTRARLRLAEGDLAAGHAAVEAALDLARTFEIAPVLPEIFVTRAALLRAEGKLDRAREDLRTAAREIDRVRGTLPAHAMRTAFSAGHRAAYTQLLALLADDASPAALEEAFAVAERSRGRTLLDLMWAAVEPSEGNGAKDAQDAKDADASDRDAARLRAEINALYSRLYDYGPGHTAPVDMAHWREETLRRERELREIERRLSIRSKRGARVARPAEVEAIGRSLAPGSALIEYVFVGDELMAFVLRSGTIELARTIADRERVTETVERLRFQLRRAASFGAGTAVPPKVTDDARRVLGILHEMLLAPLDAMLGDATHVHVVPAGPLHHVPFAALWDGERYLLERALVTSTPTASVLARVAERDETPGADCVVFGASDLQAPAIAAEVEHAARALRTSALADGAATADRFVEMSAAAGVIHLACHGRFVPSSPFASGLRFADRWFTLRDVYALRLARPVVVLSGCDTGDCATDAGEELCGLVHAFFAAGASALVMSLWPLHDETAHAVMTRFYDEASVGGRLDPGIAASALRRAQLEAMASAPHPLHWASLVFLGHSGL